MSLDVAPLGELVGVGPARHEQLAAAFLAGYRVARTREAYALGLRTWFGWCEPNRLDPLLAIRAHVDLYLRHLEAKGYADRTVAQRLSVLSTFYGYLVDEEVLDRSPVRGVKGPKVERRSPTAWLSRPQVADLLAAAVELGPTAHALLCILAFNGLRITEACSLDVASVSIERGFYPVVRFTRKGGQQGSAALARPTEAAIRAAIGDRTEGPIFLTGSGGRMNQGAAQRIIDACIPRIRGEHGRITPHVLRHSWTTLALQAGTNHEQVRHDGGWSDGRMVSYYAHGHDDPAKASTHAVAGLVMGVG